jgi:uncharacterized iron-regulated membrane protein
MTSTGQLAEQAASSGSGRHRTLRPLLLRLHFYAGILVGPFLVVAALSGMLYALTPQLEQVVYRDELKVAASDTVLPLADQVAAARAAQPTGTLLAVRPAAAEGATTRVMFAVPGLGESERLAVFVDPGTGQVTGRLTAYGSSGVLPLRTWLDQLHRNLHLGEPGRLYTELAASWLWVIAVAGLLLWWTGRRSGSRLRPHRDGIARRRTLSWHGAVGTWIALGLVFLSATGLTWSKYAGENVTQLRSALNWSTPAVTTALDTEANQPGGHEGQSGHGAGQSDGADPAPATWDRTYEAARGADLHGALELVAPVDGSAFVAKEITVRWPTQVDAAAIDPGDGKVLDVVRFDDYPLAAKLARWGIDAHMGLLFGLANQLVLAVLAAAIVAMVVWGYRMWWLRRPTRGHVRRFGRPARRGTWRHQPYWRLVLLAAGAIAVGVFLPVWGASLAAFLMIDLIAGLVRGRQTGPGAGGDDLPGEGERSEEPVQDATGGITV